MTARKAPAVKGKPWSCAECGAGGQAANAEAAAQAWIAHHIAHHQEVPF